jgi:rhamnogalacturonyl hydrolase YesR
MKEKLMTDTHKVARSLLAMQRHSWEQGTAMQAFLEMGRMDIVIPMAVEAVYRQTEDGRAATIGVNDAITDPCSVGEALIAACDETHDPALIKGRDALIAWAVKTAPRNKNGVLYHLLTSQQFWVDSMYMLPPFLVAAGYTDLALANFNGYWNALFDPQEHLMHHMWDDGNQRFERAAHWGSGNGWALAAMARLIPMIPQTDADAMKEKAVTLLKGVMAHVRHDGLFHDVVDDETSFVETNLSQMSAYTMYRGMSDGWLGVEWKPQADKLREAAEAQVNEFGFVRNVCGAPTFDKPGFSPEGQAFALLMENAAQKLQ